MPLADEIKQFVTSAGLYLKGAEPNIIPQGGLTLDGDTLRLAQQWLDRSADTYFDRKTVSQYEEEMADYLRQEDVISFSSGRASLLAIFQALELPSESQVLLPGYTCIAVANSVWFAGLSPVFYDIDLDDYGPDLPDIRKKFEQNQNIRVIILQHTYGIIGGQFLNVLNWAREHGITIIEDSAHTLDSTIEGRRAGSFADAAFFSTERSKCLSTFQGGFAVAKEDGLRNKLRELQAKAPQLPVDNVRSLIRQFIFTYKTERDPGRWYKRPWALIKNNNAYIPGVSKDELQRKMPVGYLSQLAAPLADIGRSQIKNLEKARKIRKQTALEWKEWAQNKGFRTPQIPNNSDPSFLSYPILVPPEKKQDLSWADYLRAEITRWYKTHLHPSDHKVLDCPNADIAVSRCINLPTNLAVVL